MNAATIPAAMTARPSGTGSRQNGACQSLANRLKARQNLRGEQNADRGLEERVHAADAPGGDAEHPDHRHVTFRHSRRRHTIAQIAMAGNSRSRTMMPIGSWRSGFQSVTS